MRYTVVILLALFSMGPVSAQKEVKYSRQGNKEYRGNKYDEAELLYRRSFDENPSYSDAIFNLGDALYKQDKYEDASKSFDSLSQSEIDPMKRAATLYNLGNSLLKSNKLKESIEAYKNSLRINPDNLEAKYNLAYAQDQLRNQEQQQQQQSGDDNQDKQDKDNNQEQQEESSDNKQDQNNDDQNNQDQNDQQNPESNEKDKEDQQQPRQDQMSKEDAERLLQALAADEQEVQDKVKKEKASRRRIRALKNW